MSYEFHEDPDFVLIVFLEVVLDLAWIAHLCYSMINLHLLKSNNSSEFLDTSSVRLGLKFVLLDHRFDFSKNLLFLSFKENPDPLVFRVAT